jgi:hypothetical protein
MSKQIKTIFIFDNGHLAVCDEHGEQIPELQLPVFSLFAKYAESLGYNIVGAEIRSRFSAYPQFQEIRGWDEGGSFLKLERLV